VAGLGGGRRHRDGASQYTGRQQSRRARAPRARAWWRRVREGRGADVLVTQAPPRGVGDGDDPPHRGFTALHGLVAAIRPAVLLHGHVHPCRGPGTGLAELIPARRGPAAGDRAGRDAR
jgi:hypothetical protein